MYYIPELLKKRSSGHLARCWLAATLTEAQFKARYKRRELIAIDITSLSDDIQNGTVMHKFSLYLLSQLTYGLLKLQLYQTRAVEDSCKQLQAEMMPVLATKKGRKKSNKENDLRDLPDLTADLVAPPSFSGKFLEDLARPDLHLLTEPDSSLLGLLMEAEHDFGERQFDQINEEELLRIERGAGLFGEVNDRNINAEQEIARDEVVKPSQMPLSELNSNDSILRTPSKRARKSHTDTPSKRRRYSKRAQFDSLENQENYPPMDQHKITSPNHSTATIIQPFIENPSRTTLNEDVGEDQKTVDESRNSIAQEPAVNLPLTHSSTIPSDFTLEPLRAKEVLPRRRMKRVKFLDLETFISNDAMKKQIASSHALTRTIKMSRIDIHRIRLDSQSLFNVPSSSVRLGKKRMWADHLLKLFADNIRGPFHVSNDESEFLESIRERDTTAGKTAELSNDVNHIRFLIPESPQRSVAEPVVNVRDVPHAEIPRESVDVGDIGNLNQQIPENESKTSSDGRTSLARIERTTRSIASHDSFTLHITDEVHAHGRSSSGDATVDINDITSASRSRSGSRSFSPLWTKAKLFDELKKLWDENPQRHPIKFKDVFPPETTTKSSGACGILDLLHLAMDMKIQLQQSQPYEHLYIFLNHL